MTMNGRLKPPTSAPSQGRAADMSADTRQPSEETDEIAARLKRDTEERLQASRKLIDATRRTLTWDRR